MSGARATQYDLRFNNVVEARWSSILSPTIVRALSSAPLSDYRTADHTKWVGAFHKKQDFIDVVEPPSSDKVKETDDDFAIVLELSEDDPHFDKKKKLLQNKGFNPKEQVYLKSSSGPDWISTTLKVMLQIARIIQLDEKLLQNKGFNPKEQVYLKSSSGPDWISTTLKVMLQIARIIQLDEVLANCSFSVFLVCFGTKLKSGAGIACPRNEVEALNSILLLLDISVSSGMRMQMNVLQELREAIIGMIHDFGDKNSVKTTILENHSCGKEECLLQWGKNNGIRTRLQIAYVEGADRGAIARENLNVGDIAVEIPVSTVISEELIRESNMVRFRLP
nr:hypothetical protein CFP56_68547 [Quercus suber]